MVGSCCRNCSEIFVRGWVERWRVIVEGRGSCFSMMEEGSGCRWIRSWRGVEWMGMGVVVGMV